MGQAEGRDKKRSSMLRSLDGSNGGFYVMFSFHSGRMD